MSSAKFTELMSREQKEEYAKQRLNEMKLKNQKILQRHAEVENDRINAESQNSAVTCAKVSSGSSFRRGTTITNQNKLNEENKTEHAREWDRGKPNLDDWNQPEPAKHQYRNFRGSGRYERKDVEKIDNRNSYSRKESSEYSHHDRRAKGEFNVDEQLNRGGWQNPPLKAPYKTYYKAGVQGDPVDDWNYGKEEKYPSDDWNIGKKDRYPSDDWNAEKRNSYKGYNKNEGREYAPDNKKLQENWRSKPSDRNQYNSSRFQVSPRRTRGIGYRNDSHRKYQNYHSDDKFKKSDFKQSNSRKKYSHKTHSRSSSKSESDGMENQFTLRTYNLWQNDKSNEDQTKQTRVEKWVKSVNKSNMWAEKQLSSEEKDNYGNQFSSEKQESSRKPVTKFDRIKISSEKDSDEDNINLNTSEDIKTRESKDFTSQQYNYKQNSSLNTGSSPNSELINKTEQPNNKQNSDQNTGYSSISEFAKKTVGHYKKGFQSKRSPPFRFGGGSVNENMSKQKKDTRSYKSDDVKNKYKFKRSNNSSSDDKWKSSRNENIVNKNCCEVDQKNSDIVDEWNAADGDGLWGEAEQSNIKWNLSDEESNFKEPKKENKEQKKQANPDDPWNNCSQISKRSKLSTELPDSSKKTNSDFNNGDGWSDVDQSDTEWKNDDGGAHFQKNKDQNFEHMNKSAVHYAVQEVVKSDLRDGRKECEENNIAKKFSVKDNKSCELVAQEKSYKDVLRDVNDADCRTASPSGLTNIQQQEKFKEDNVTFETTESIPVSLLDEKHTDVSTHERVCSDDGGWSTVSEEGEVE